MCAPDSGAGCAVSFVDSRLDQETGTVPLQALLPCGCIMTSCLATQHLPCPGACPLVPLSLVPCPLSPCPAPTVKRRRPGRSDGRVKQTLGKQDGRNTTVVTIGDSRHVHSRVKGTLQLPWNSGGHHCASGGVESAGTGTATTHTRIIDTPRLPAPCLHHRRSPCQLAALQRTHLSTSVTACTVPHACTMYSILQPAGCIAARLLHYRRSMAVAATGTQIYQTLPISPISSSRFIRIGTEMTYSNTCDPARPPAESQRSITSQILIPWKGREKKKCTQQLTNPRLLYHLGVYASICSRF